MINFANGIVTTSKSYGKNNSSKYEYYNYFG